MENKKNVSNTKKKVNKGFEENFYEELTFHIDSHLKMMANLETVGFNEKVESINNHLQAIPYLKKNKKALQSCKLSIIKIVESL